MPPSLRTGLALLVVLLAALALRTCDLAARPMHADEANQAVKFGHLLESGRYAFDPEDHHGPTLYYLALLPAWARGERTLAALTETTVRLTPALFGTAAVALVFLLGRPLGRWPALAAAALAAVSPAAVYYSRYFIQETLLVAFTLAFFGCGIRWWRTGRIWWAVGGGACAGLMLATKATAPLFLAVAVLAVAAAVDARGRDSAAKETGRRLRDRRPGQALSAGALAAAVVAGLFYSSFFTHPKGLADALGSLGPALARAGAGDTGHEKPWWYYASLFLYRREGGYLWDQTAFLALAATGLFLALRRGAPRSLRFHGLYGSILALAFSLVPYKTPWTVVHLVPPLAILAAAALAALAGRPAAGGARARQVAGALVFVAVLAWQAHQTWRSSFARPADARNPFAYVHSVPDVLKVPGLVAQIDDPAGAIKVISDEYWPLPWYLRRHPQVGYWNNPPENCDGALVFAGVEQAGLVRERLRGRYREGLIGLRPGVVLVVFTPLP